jgi:hypothetical protein
VAEKHLPNPAPVQARLKRRLSPAQFSRRYGVKPHALQRRFPSENPSCRKQNLVPYQLSFSVVVRRYDNLPCAFNSLSQLRVRAPVPGDPRYRSAEKSLGVNAPSLAVLAWKVKFEEVSSQSQNMRRPNRVAYRAGN